MGIQNSKIQIKPLLVFQRKQDILFGFEEQCVAVLSSLLSLNLSSLSSEKAEGSKKGCGTIFKIPTWSKPVILINFLSPL